MFLLCILKYFFLCVFELLLRGYRACHSQVTPVYSAATLVGNEQQRCELVESVAALLPKLHSLLLGPGMGRDPAVLLAAADIVREARLRHLPVVLDADSLAMVAEHPDTVSDYPLALLTPNVNEFRLLCERVERDTAGQTVAPSSPSPLAGGAGAVPATVGGVRETEGGRLKKGRAIQSKAEAVERVAKHLGGVVVVLKGEVDVISDGTRTIACAVPGGLKRCGGIGDVLSGAMATALAWYSIQRVQGDEVRC